jgi:hypothetical protein
MHALHSILSTWSIFLCYGRTRTHLELLAAHSELREVVHAWPLHQLTRFAHKEGVLGIEIDGNGAFFFSMMDASAPVRRLREQLSLLNIEQTTR